MTPRPPPAFGPRPSTGRFAAIPAGYPGVPTAATREGGDVIGVVLVAGIFAALAGLALIGWARDRHRARAAPSGDPWAPIVRELRSARVADDPLIPDNRRARRS